MHDQSGGCLLILLSVGGASLLTLFLLAAVMGDTPPGTHRGSPTWLLVSCGVAWLFVVGVILAEAIRDQRRPRR